MDKKQKQACEYCIDHDDPDKCKPIMVQDGICVYIFGGNLCAWRSGGFAITRIDYCPVCGRQMTGGNEE